MNVLGLILARGGSKRVHKKNIRLLHDVPLIAWTISAARIANSLDRVVVSSDDKEIRDISREWGAETIVRPPELATDKSSSYPAILHALDELGSFDYVCLLQPTSPLRTAMDIDFSVCSAVVGELPALVSVEYGKRVPNGAIYVARTDWLRDTLANGNEAPFDGLVPKRFEMPAMRSIDIDTEEDFELAEHVATAWQQ